MHMRLLPIFPDEIPICYVHDLKRIYGIVPLLSAIISVSECARIPVVAEGEEERPRIGSFRMSGSDTFRRCHFAKPMPVKVFEEKHTSSPFAEKYACMGLRPWKKNPVFPKKIIYSAH